MIFLPIWPPYCDLPMQSAHEGRREWERKIMNTTDHTTTDKRRKKEKKSGLGYIHFQHKKGSKNSSLVGLKHESNTYTYLSTDVQCVDHDNDTDMIQICELDADTFGLQVLFYVEG